MGIGNEHPQVSRRGVVGLSLPLMGIGNPRVSPEATIRRDWYSLPLMGIGNRSRRRHLRDDPELITPHGDWKRSRVWRSTARHMRLITPHGDWKL